MRLSDGFFYTIRENIKDEDSVSGNLLVRSGMIKKISAGVYSYMPLGYKVLKNIEQVIREEMNKTGAQELLMPSLIPNEIFERSGRIKNFGPSIFTLSDRFEKNYVLGPTHEELFAIAASMKVKSYRDLPFNIYQFQNKFRDEARPRYGAIRVREFIMKDAYSFDTDYSGLDKSYQKIYDAYKASFDRMGLNYKIVKADTGVMGGLLSEEWQAVTDIGEDTLVLCDKCSYSSNIEVSECVNENILDTSELLTLEKIHTPKSGTIKQLIDNYQFNVDKMIKSLIYKADDKFILAMVRSDDEVNETKLRKLLNLNNLELADDKDVEKITNSSVGFAGPIGIKIEIVGDFRIKGMKNFIVGANMSDYHYKNANFERDFEVNTWADIRNIKENDICPKCGGRIYFKKGIEVGNTFKLGTKYTEALDVNYLDNNNELHPVVMGSYGIGLGRCMAAIVEQNNDEKGIIWPMSIAPYKVAILSATNDEKQLKVANDIYNELNKLNISVLLDDRDERAGVKFNDLDLIGIPVRITVGRKINEDLVELKLRHQQEFYDIKINEIINKIQEIIK